MEKEIDELLEMDRKAYSDSELCRCLLCMIQEHLVEIYELKEQNNPHIIEESADLAILARMFAKHMDADEEVFKRRLLKFREKIKENCKKKK